MIGTELGSDAIREKLDLCKVRTLRESYDSLRTSHGTCLLATSDATPFFDGTGQRWEIQEKVKAEPYTTKIQDHHELQKSQKAVLLLPTRCNSVSLGCHCGTGLGNLTELNRHELLATC